jgi:hypothetical protein
VRHRSPQARTRQGAVAASRLAALLAVLSLAGCAAQTDPAVSTRGFHLVERSGYQVLYDSKGRIQRLLQDANHDGVADAQVLYWPNGKPRAGEIDTDGDGRVDRWETFDTEGKLTRVAGTPSGATTNSESALPERPGAPTR